jgi:hypothetical protein
MMVDTDAFYTFKVRGHPNAIYGHLHDDNEGTLSFNGIRDYTHLYLYWYYGRTRYIKRKLT